MNLREKLSSDWKSFSFRYHHRFFRTQIWKIVMIPSELKGMQVWVGNLQILESEKREHDVRAGIKGYQIVRTGSRSRRGIWAMDREDWKMVMRFWRVFQMKKIRCSVFMTVASVLCFCHRFFRDPDEGRELDGRSLDEDGVNMMFGWWRGKIAFRAAHLGRKRKDWMDEIESQSGVEMRRTMFFLDGIPNIQKYANGS